MMWLRIGTSEGLFLNTVMNLRVPQNAEKFLSGCTTDGFSKRTQLRECMSDYISVLNVNF
jgi:hypothetical protein